MVSLSFLQGELEWLKSKDMTLMKKNKEDMIKAESSGYKD